MNDEHTLGHPPAAHLWIKLKDLCDNISKQAKKKMATFNALEATPSYSQYQYNDVLDNILYLINELQNTALEISASQQPRVPLFNHSGSGFTSRDLPMSLPPPSINPMNSHPLSLRENSLNSLSIQSSSSSSSTASLSTSSSTTSLLPISSSTSSPPNPDLHLLSPFSRPTSSPPSSSPWSLPPSSSSTIPPSSNAANNNSNTSSNSGSSSKQTRLSQIAFLDPLSIPLEAVWAPPAKVLPSHSPSSIPNTSSNSGNNNNNNNNPNGNNGPSPSPIQPLSPPAGDASNTGGTYFGWTFRSTTGPPKKRGRRGRLPADNSNVFCYHCGVKETPEWRRGPAGPKTLCNACGLQYTKKLKEGKMKEKGGKGGGGMGGGVGMGMGGGEGEDGFGQLRCILSKEEGGERKEGGKRKKKKARIEAEDGNLNRSMGGGEGSGSDAVGNGGEDGMRDGS
eukprot:TRINITY_DN84_c2_g1_i2.p1 TRINITY_DN84_c2_g1~~TRINITY_DN84_c2_g1_i2.p1  ORF type:complete len:451 (-),score=222.29 TRINITY_DN84_c2_g1_i2:118-1470(-)